MHATEIVQFVYYGPVFLMVLPRDIWLKSDTEYAKICSERHNFEGVMKTDYHIGHYFKKLHFLMEQSMNRQLQELDLTNAQGHAIGYLTCHSEAPCARDLEIAYGLSHATVSGILSRMEGKGFIEIRPDQKDRRVKRIYLMEKGKACSKEIAQRIAVTEQTMAQGFSTEELELFQSFLERAARNLNAAVLESNTKREE